MNKENSKKDKTKKSLGRGLGAILKDSKISLKDKKMLLTKDDNEGILEIPIAYIETNPWQPRHKFDETALNELANSIKSQGIIQPITLRKLSDKKYQLISGERRLQASKKLANKTITAFVRTANNQQMLEMSLIENIQRENLNPIEIALSFQRLITECKLKQETLAKRVGKNRASVTNFLRLLKLPPEIQEAIKNSKLSMGHAKAILSLTNIDMQLDCFKEVMLKKMSVRQTEQLIQSYSEEKMNPLSASSPSQKNNIDREIIDLTRELSSHFGTKIRLKIDNKTSKGELKIPFLSKNDLNRILEIINAKR